MQLPSITTRCVHFKLDENPHLWKLTALPQPAYNSSPSSSSSSSPTSGRGRSCLYLATAQETVSSQMLLSGSVWLQPTVTETQLYSMWGESDYGIW